MATTAAAYMAGGVKSDYLITNRRREERLRNISLETTQYYARTDMKSRFEETTSLAINRKHILRKFNELKATESTKLEERRDRLRQLLKDDEERYRQSLQLKEETRESRVEGMRQRMNELKEQRERERKAVVEEKLKQRWRKECDELRAVESKMLEKRVSEARAGQIQEQEERKVLDRKEKQYYDDLWEQDRQKKIHREEADRAKQKAINEDMISVLGQQLYALKMQAVQAEELKQEEARLMREDLEMRILEDQRRHQRKLQEQRAIRDDLDTFNRMKAEQRQQEIQEALEMDMRILAELIKLDRAEREANSRRREELKREMQLYREHLMRQRVVEVERAKEIEKWYANEQERLWKVRSEKWRKEQAARDRLMKEVMAGRQEQLQHALERNRQAQEQVRLEKQRLEQTIAEAKTFEAAEHAKHAKSKREYSHMLKEQMETAERRRADEKRRIEMEDAAERAMHQQYEDTLQQELARIRQAT
ncbi:tumor suppressor, Mitostatin-domain-containing protein [Entophlyctis helioformis]|nr:tumor suppressor, Mitostatin-domain-containing protein [Entophlyctis helioformis]